MFQPTHVVNSPKAHASEMRCTSQARVHQHMKLKERVTACVRQAVEQQEMEECTFHPRCVEHLLDDGDAFSPPK